MKDNYVSENIDDTSSQEEAPDIKGFDRFNVLYIKGLQAHFKRDNQEIVNDIQSLQQMEQQLFNSLETNTNLSTSEQQKVVEKMNQWFDEGHHIVLTTARPENLREITIEEMNILGIPFHQLVMGIGRAERILINNKSNTRPTEVRAVGIQVGKNEGFENIEI